MESSSKEKDRLKTKIIAIRVTNVEFLKISRFAEEFNLPVGMYMRLCSLLGSVPYAARSVLAGSGVAKVTSVKPKHGEDEVVVERRRHQSRAVSK